MPPIPPWAYAGAALLSIGGGFVAGWKVQGWRCEAAQAEALREAAAALDKANRDITAISTRYEQEKADAAQTNHARTEQVRTIFRDRVVPADCAAPGDARRLLEQGVSEVNAAVASEPRAAVPAASAAP